MRILIIGNEGAGKSVLATRISLVTGIPVTHLDLFAWTKTFRKMPEPVFRQRLAIAMSDRNMIIEGWAIQATMKERLRWADLIIYLCYPAGFCLHSVAARNLEYNYRRYPYDVFEGDRLAQVGFYTEMINRIHQEYEPEVQVWLKELEERKKIYTYYSREDLEAGYETLIRKIAKITGKALKGRG